MDPKTYDVHDVDVAWCPGCGNFPLLAVLKKVLAGLDIPPERVIISSGIGQAAKTPQYLACHYFNGLHGRALPPATAIKAVSPDFTVIVESGEGCSYGEGGNHFIHTIRRNPDITHIVHNNMVYGLTKGQASPTSARGFVTPVQTTGVFEEPFNPIAVAVALDAPFVARVFVGEQNHAVKVLQEAIQHPGYALVDVLQPCVSFNKVNTYAWFKQHTYVLDTSYDPTDRAAAFRTATDPERFALGVIYRTERRTPFERNLSAYAANPRPVRQRTIPHECIQAILAAKTV